MKHSKRLQKHAFNLHPSCYLNSAPGFCKIAANPFNYDALLSGYQFADFFGDDLQLALQQVRH